MKLDNLDLRRREGPKGQARWFRYTSASSLGLEIAVAIVGSTLAARYVENNWSHWSPWTTLIGLFIGCGAAGLAIQRTIKEQKAWEEAKAERAAEAGDAGSDEPSAPAGSREDSGERAEP